MRNSVNCAVNKSYGLEMCQPLNVWKNVKTATQKLCAYYYISTDGVEQSMEIGRCVFRRGETAINTSTV